MATLDAVRFIIQRQTGQPIEHEQVIIWANDLNMDVGAVINVPGTTYQIAINTTDLTYHLPDDLKQINRMWLQSEYDSGLDRDIKIPYRIYDGTISFPVPFSFTDTLNIDYYKFLTTYNDISDTLDLPDRYVPLYANYCMMRYYELTSTSQQIGAELAIANQQRFAQMYATVKNQVIQNYSFTNPDLSVVERW